MVAWTVMNFLTKDPREEISKISIVDRSLYIKFFRGSREGAPKVVDTVKALATSLLLGDFDVHNENIVNGRKVDLAWSFYYNTKCHFALQRSVIFETFEEIYSKSIGNPLLITEMTRLADLVISQKSSDSNLSRLISRTINFFNINYLQNHLEDFSGYFLGVRRGRFVNLEEVIRHNHLYHNAIEMKFMSFALECVHLIKGYLNSGGGIDAERKEELKTRFNDILQKSRRFKESVSVEDFPIILVRQMEINAFTAYVLAFNNIFKDPAVRVTYRNYVIKELNDEEYKEIFETANERANILRFIKINYSIKAVVEPKDVKSKLEDNLVHLRRLAERSRDNKEYLSDFVRKVSVIWGKKYFGEVMNSYFQEILAKPSSSAERFL
jgi:hypothetical protein